MNDANAFNFDERPFSTAFKRIYLHKYAEPAGKLRELLMRKDRTALKVFFDTKDNTIISITSFFWAKRYSCVASCTVVPCFSESGDIDIWSIGDVILYESEYWANYLQTRSLQRAFYGYEETLFGTETIARKERWYIAEDYGNYDGWLQCEFARKFLEVHPQCKLQEIADEF